MDLHQQKEELRQKLLEQRESIPLAEFYDASAHIIGTLKKQDEYKQAATIHSYVSMNSRREIETQELIREMLSKGREVIVPVTNFDEGTLSHHRLGSFDELESNKWGVLEPPRGQEITPQKIELVLVPMVAGDEECNRLGYGEGFYDRFLKDVVCPKIGLIFEQNIVDSLPVEDFDVPLDKIITEDRVIRRQ